jgi:antitoxin VapB
VIDALKTIEYGIYLGICLGDLMAIERHVRLFRNGRNQAVRIPREFELPGDEAVMRREGDRLVIEPLRKRTLRELLDIWEPVDEEFPPIEELPYEEINL